jgi:hypothetical protein
VSGQIEGQRVAGRVTVDTRGGRRFAAAGKVSGGRETENQEKSVGWRWVWVGIVRLAARK